MAHIGWSADGTAAHLYDDNGNRIPDQRWVQGRPDISTFDPFTYGYGQGQAAMGGYYYDAWAGGEGGAGAGGGATGAGAGYYYPPEKTELDLLFDQLALDYADRQKARDARRREFEEGLQFDRWSVEQEMAMIQAQIASSEGMQRYEWEQRFKELERQHTFDVEMMQLDWSERQKLVDKELAVELQAIWSGERIAAATIAAKPINYRVYEHWLAGKQATADPSGLPAGAPAFQTGPGMEGAVVPGQAPGPSPYAQAYATGQRIPEFEAYGRTPTAIGGEPWVDPHKMNVSQFTASPLQSQEMQYGRWWEGGLMPNTAKQRMWAAAPTGGAQGAPGYG